MNSFKTIFFLLTLLLPSILYPQSDSLIIELNSLGEDTLKANKYNEVAFSYLYSDREKCQNYADSAIILSKKLKYGKAEREARYIKATAYNFSGEDEKSLAVHVLLQKDCEAEGD